jgi:cupin-like protein
MHPVPEYDSPTPEQFRSEILPLGQPAVLRGIAADWPLVRAAKAGAEQWMAMLSASANDEPVTILRTDPQNEGRFHYTPDGRALNFGRANASLAELLAMLREQAGNARPYALAAQGVDADSVVPGFADSHPLRFVPDSAAPRIWIGNAAKVATHNDPSENVAVVVAGRRRFTLFPPDQIANLYLGPLHFTPAGVPISMVHVTAPDLERYPRFAEARDAALTAELGPGDALFIPYAWYHHVESLEPFNMLVNYWWNAARTDAGSPRNAMLHALMSLAHLPPHQRAAWKALFDHVVFRLDGDPAAHLDPALAGVLGEATPETIAAMRQALIDALTKDAKAAG